MFKKMPFWLKSGISLSLVIFLLFLIGGIFAAISNNGKCFEPPCSAGSGKCDYNLEGCFDFSNPVLPLLMLPTSLIFYSTSRMTGIYNLFISPLFNIFPMQLFEYVIVNLVLYFAIGAILGAIFEKAKLRLRMK